MSVSKIDRDRVEAYIQRKINRLNNSSKINPLFVFKYMLDNWDELNDKPAMDTFISQDKVLEKTEKATAISNQLLADSDLKAQVLALIN